MDAALIGCGFIGSFIAERVAKGELDLGLKLLFDRHREKIERVQGLFQEPPEAAQGIERIIASDVGLVIEAASVEAVQSFAEDILGSGKDMMVMSVGAFSKPGFYERIEEVCMKRGVRVYIPSGAIGGLDAIHSAAQGRLEEVEITTIKSPASLEGAPYVVEKGIELSGLEGPVEVFAGPAGEAIQGFPSNVNVAVALGLAGVGAWRTRVKVIADPGVKRNIHEIRARGDFGRLTFRVENLPSPDNPRTSLLAALSAVSTLKKLTQPVRLG